MFVFDTSAFLNGSRHHYFLDTMRPIWTLVEEAIDNGRVVLPREVYREIVAQDDEISTLIKGHKESVAEPSRRSRVAPARSSRSSRNLDFATKPTPS